MRATWCADALAQRVADCQARVVLTASAGMRGKKPIQLKQIVDKGLRQAEKLGAQVWFARAASVCPPRSSRPAVQSVQSVHASAPLAG